MSNEELKQGIIEAYIHSNKKIGVLVDLRCETDFVAKTEEFKKLAHELSLQIAAMKPLFLRPEDIPEEFLAGERKIFEEQLKNSGKPKHLIEEILNGKLKKYKEEISLLSQPWIKDETKTIKDLIDEYSAKFGEKIIIKRFVRFEI
jgi:elongation factor Ts